MFYWDTFDDKVQEVKYSKENNSNVIEEYQLTNQLASYCIISSVKCPYIEGKSNRRNQRETLCTRKWNTFAKRANGEWI